jgi:hypothetical protein
MISMNEINENKKNKEIKTEIKTEIETKTGTGIKRATERTTEPKPKNGSPIKKPCTTIVLSGTASEQSAAEPINTTVAMTGAVGNTDAVGNAGAGGGGNPNHDGKQIPGGESQ